MSSNANAILSEREHMQPSYFQSQRALLVSDIAQSLDSVLTNLNRLNRSLEAVIAVGNEFSSVEALWSTFEGVMGEQQSDPSQEGTSKESNHVIDTQSKPADT